MKLVKPPSAEDLRGPAVFAPIKTYELVVDTSVVLAGTIDDWPAKAQDAVLEALERKSKEVGRPLKIVMSRSGRDDGKPYIHVIASEIVAALVPSQGWVR